MARPFRLGPDLAGCWDLIIALTREGGFSLADARGLTLSDAAKAVEALKRRVEAEAAAARGD